MDRNGMDLGAGLRDRFSRGVDHVWSRTEFQDLALQAFRHQFRENGVYRAYCRGRNATPEGVTRWQDVPPVPTSAFKAVPLVSGDPARVEARFRTSGTTRGSEARGVHHVLDLGLYDASLVPNFHANILPEGNRLPFLSLIPSPDRAPDSSLSHMVGVAEGKFGAPGGGWFMDPETGLEARGFADALERSESVGEPVLVLGTAFALVHWLDSRESSGRTWTLPPGSRLMETGGFKGRSREVPRKDLYRALSTNLGLPEHRMVNEYGMTELCSQFYEPVLREGPTSLRRLVGPPWVRTRVLDPVTLEPVPDGEVGILCHFDLANLGSVCHVLTEDRGVAVSGGFRVLGRSPGAEPRGCSLAAEELMEAERKIRG
jgi:hypothetical protein